KEIHEHVQFCYELFRQYRKRNRTRSTPAMLPPPPQAAFMKSIYTKVQPGHAASAAAATAVARPLPRLAMRLNTPP
ncbi:unnamed protein product, partial [Urochloa humidicola]